MFLYRVAGELERVCDGSCYCGPFRFLGLLGWGSFDVLDQNASNVATISNFHTTPLVEFIFSQVNPKIILGHFLLSRHRKVGYSSSYMILMHLIRPKVMGDG